MNFSKADLPHIKLSLFVFTLSLVTGGSMIGLGTAYESSAINNKHAAEKQLGEARSRLGAAQNDLENMSSYATEYASLLDQKIVAVEQRLDWMEELEKLRQQHHVIDFKYTITPQQTYTPNPALEQGNFEIYLSGVNLQMDLLHEMQLIKFFASLRSDMQGKFIIDHCTLERSITGNATEPLVAENSGAQLKADCTGGWITMKNRNAS
jgi:hypothetical protein